MPGQLAEAISSIASNFRPVYSRMLDETSWANECVHCGSPQGNFYMHSEPDGPFFGDASDFGGVAVDLPAVDVVIS